MDNADRSPPPGGRATDDASESAVHGGHAHSGHPFIRLGSLDNWRWSSGNREDGREDIGSIASGLSRAGSYEDLSREGSRRGYRRDASEGGSTRRGSRFADIAKAHQNGMHEMELARLSHTGRAHSRQGNPTWHGGNFYHEIKRSPFHELPGQGGPLQDGAGLSMRALRAAAEHPPSGPSSADGDSEKGRGSTSVLKYYIFNRLRGQLDTAHPRPSHWWGMIIMPLGAFISILYVSGLNRYTLPSIDMRVLNAPLGATAVLLFAVPESKLSQPRNVVGGQILSAVVGCTVRCIFPEHLTWVSAPVAVGVAVFFMMLTRTVHPPGGATALLIAALQPKGKWSSWIYVPAFAVGTIGMQLIAFIMNLITPGRAYPTFWWGSDNFFGGL